MKIHKRHIFLLAFLLVVAIPVTVLLSMQQQITQQQAAYLAAEVLTEPTVEVASEIPNVTFTTSDTGRLMEYLKDYNLLSSEGVRIALSDSKVPVRNFVFKLVPYEQPFNKHVNSSGKTTSSIGQTYDGTSKVMTFGLYLSAETIAGMDDASLTSKATSSILFFLYDIGLGLPREVTEVNNIITTIQNDPNTIGLFTVKK